VNPTGPAPAHGAQPPSAWVRRFTASLARGATVLDLACGQGRHARWLARRGHAVLAVDRDAACGAALAGEPGVRFLQADLEAAPWPFEGQRFDGIIVTQYLHRPLLAAIVAALAPGGLLVYETFAQGNERYGRPSNPDFLLAPGELLATCRDLHVLAYEDGVLDLPRPARVQRIAAQRPPAPDRCLQLDGAVPD
jgi:SAM-dependent methyltransferase